jgi:hypothetical protein
VSAAYFVHCFRMDNAAEIRHSKSDEVFYVDGDTMGGQGSKESATMLKKWRNSLPVLRQTDQQGKTSYPFLESPDDRDITMFTILMVTKPFATAKGKGVVEAWQAAVDEMNCQINKATGCNLFDPPIAIRTVCCRFDNAMKLIKEACAAVPFHSGCNDEASPNNLQSLLESLYKLKNLHEEGQQGQKLSALAQKKKDCEAAKAIQEAAIGWFSLSSSEDSEEAVSNVRKPKQAKTESGEKSSHGSLQSLFGSMCKSIEEHKSIAAQELALKNDLLHEQMLLKKTQVEAQLKMKEEKHQLQVKQDKQQLEHDKQQLLMKEKMMAMMELMMKKNENK